ncbi:hypothetical protein FACS189487_05440 [Campylobacterota bacterium]|nr:hypothetical protein FACS189487_05440 [Campylobacterota bacterium]
MFYKNNIETIDFGALYMEQKKLSSFRQKTEGDWDKKAASMADNFGGLYPSSFCNEIDDRECETLLDLGCAAGTIAIPLAHRFKRVFAVDFSQEMLNSLAKNCTDRKIENIVPIKCDIEGDWSEIPNADIIVASRSTEVGDMSKFIKNINDHARKRVYLSYKVGGAFLHAPILEAIGRKIYPKPDYIYLLNILYNMGIFARVKFIESEGKRFNYHNEEDYISGVESSIGKLSAIEKDRLAKYLDRLRENTIENTAENRSDEKMIWALIAYNV